MLTPRELMIVRAVVSALAAVPAGMLLGESTLRADAARIAIPRATTAELDVAIEYCDTTRRIAGIEGEVEKLWQITEAGRLWRAQNR